MKTSRLLAALAAFVLVCALVFVFGFVSSRVLLEAERFPLGTVNRLADALAAPVRAALREDSEPDWEAPSEDEIHLFSTFVPLLGRVFDVPPATRSGAGGALASVGPDILVLTHEGQIFIADGQGHIADSGLQPPPNGFADYMALTEDPRYQDYEHRPDWFRYNDIKYLRLDGKQYIVVSFTEFHQERECYTTTVSRLEIGSASPEPRTWTAAADDWQTLFRSEPCLPLKRQWRALEGHMAGGRLAFDGAENLYLATGEYHWDGMYGPKSLDPQRDVALAQDPRTDYGKVIRIDLRSGTSRHVSRGHRNPQGIAIDGSGEVWVAEHGMRGGDELNHVREGANFGWPLESYGTLYSGLPIPGTYSIGRHETFERPVFAWLPSIATSGLAYIQGFHETWDGDLLVASLRGQQLVRVRIRENRAIFAEPIEVGKRIRYVLQHTDGQIVLWTDDRELIFLTPSQGGLGYRFVRYYVEEKMDGGAAMKSRVLGAMTQCMECHSLEPGNSENAPSLAGVFGAPIGGTAYAGYSEAMKTRHGTWSRALLAEYLADPAAVVPGTTMPDPGLNDPEVRGAVVDALAALATTKEIPVGFR